MGLKIDLRCSCKVEAAAQTFDGSFRQLSFSPSSHISTSFTVGDPPTQLRAQLFMKHQRCDPHDSGSSVATDLLCTHTHLLLDC